MRNPIIHRVFAVLVGWSFLSACGDAGDVSSAAPQDATLADGLADSEDGNAITAGDEGREEPPTWPEGPYGTNYLDVIADEGFFDPWTGETTRLSDFYGDPLVNGILIVSAAGWCTACSYEAWDLVEVYEQYADYGLVVLYTLYEDAAGRPLWVDGAPMEDWERDFIFMTQYRESLGALARLPPREANYQVLIDRGHTLGTYFNRNATPLTLIVRASDMRIIYKEVGYSAGMVQNMVKAALF